jgi:RimJ/RimL family protein N-acetyltransferase
MATETNRHPPRELFQTERLRVRHIDYGDLDAMYAVYGDAEAMRWVDNGLPMERSLCEQWIGITHNNYTSRGYGMSALELMPSGEVVGFCGIVHPDGQPEPELKYAVLRQYWGQGIATEAAHGMLDYAATELGLHRIIATVAPEHAVSQRVLSKAGMSRGEPMIHADGSRTEVFKWLNERGDPGG